MARQGLHPSAGEGTGASERTLGCDGLESVLASSRYDAFRGRFCVATGHADWRLRESAAQAELHQAHKESGGGRPPPGSGRLYGETS
jgi:hypothetical protein